MYAVAQLKGNLSPQRNLVSDIFLVDGKRYKVRKTNLRTRKGNLEVDSYRAEDKRSRNG